jgi:hypothetical protein
MGVDARILIKITKPESWLNPTSLRQLSARLTNVIGPEYFFLRPEEDRHALSFVLDETAKWATKYPDDYPNFSPEGPAIWSQDGDDIVAEPNEQFIEVHVGGRYYGESYARGDWKSLSWIMMWCVYNIPDSEVWYGGDSSGICAEHMTSRRMNKMTKYYLTEGNDSYWMNSKSQYPCEFCGVGCVNSGGGGGIGFWHCDSCGTQWVTHDPSGDRPRSFRDETPGSLVTKYDRYGTDRDLGPSDAMATFGISDQIKAGKRKLYPFDGTFRQTYPYVPKEETKALPEPSKLLAAGD